jgi:hypothetical protein
MAYRHMERVQTESTDMIGKIIRHLQSGTLMKVTKEKLRYELGIKEAADTSRWGADSEEKATEFLAARSMELAVGRKKNCIVIFVDASDNAEKFVGRFKSTGNDIRTVDIEKPDQLLLLPLDEVACIVSSFFNAGETMRIGSFLLRNELTREIPFEYILLPGRDFSRVKAVDKYTDYSFTSPLFADNIDYLDIYEESLTRFEQKCDIRDYMDLCQAMKHIAKNNISGAVAEFGSFRGHSGYLITRTFSKLNVQKDIMLFDMFESFPPESIGVDYFWDKHTVNYEEVKSKFLEFKNVQLVKGDFTETILNYPDIKLSLIFIDCDSYRATKFLVNHLFDKHLSDGGLLVFEDYGHPALLGNRLAVHECFDHRKDCFTFYSQFSGFYMVAKNFSRS